MTWGSSTTVIIVIGAAVRLWFHWRTTGNAFEKDDERIHTLFNKNPDEPARAEKIAAMLRSNRRDDHDNFPQA